MTEAAVEAVGLGRRYRGRWALRDCNLRVEVGTVTGLVGPNGAGKSTLMRLCAGLSRPTTGSILVLGHEVRPNGTEHLARVGYLDQSRPMYRSLRVEEAMQLGRRLNERWDDDAAHAWISELDLPLRSRVGALSEGQAAMVALIVCMAKMPDVLVLDEPLASLDPLARRQLLETLLDGVAERNTTVLLSSHIISELEPVCDHVVILGDGQVRIAGSVEALLAEHRTIVTGPGAPPLPEALETVSDRSAQRQSTLLVRGDTSQVSSQTQVLDADLEEIVLAYLASGRGATSGRTKESAAT